MQKKYDGISPQWRPCFSWLLGEQSHNVCDNYEWGAFDRGCSQSEESSFVFDKKILGALTKQFTTSELAEPHPTEVLDSHQ